jgi:O-antigen/teichoic acid export membrane protein
MQDTKDSENYKETLRSTSLFGSVQFFDIIVRIVRSKFIAVLLGPTGLGISGLLNSTIELISAITNFGLRASAVRDIAEANATGDAKQVSLVINVLKKLLWYTGLMGSLVCLVGASYWSRLTFGNSDYTFAFILLSSAILLMQLAYGQNAILQGLQKYRYLAKANVIGHTIGLLVTIPLYYIWGIDAIVPVLLLSNITTFFLAYYYARKVKIEHTITSLTDVRKIGSNMLRMGMLISMQGLLSTLSAYLVRIFISKHGGVLEVGLYNAGFTIINTYIGLVLTAMATDYYPRLSKVAKVSIDFFKIINQQAEISLLLLTPIVIAFIVFIKYAVVILYSSKFLSIEGMLYWAISVTLFKTMAWTLSFSLLAKGDTKAFFWSELSAIIYGFGLNVAGYYWYGLTGLGISFFIIYILYFIQLWIVVRKRYEFSFSKIVWRSLLIMSLFVLIAIMIRLFVSGWVMYVIGSILFLSVMYYSFVELDKLIEIKKIVYSRLNHKRNS